MKSWEKMAISAGSVLVAACSLGTDPTPEPTPETTQSLSGPGVVTFQGSGNFTRWLKLASPIQEGAPPELEAAFPVGAPFAVTAAYDPAEVDSSIVPFPGAVLYQSTPGFTSVWLAAPGHTIISDPAPDLFVDVANELLVDNGPDVPDRLGVQSLGWVDGDHMFAGYRVGFANVTLTGEHKNVLSGTGIPAELCLAEWKILRFTVNFSVVGGSSVAYMLEGYGDPDRSIDSDADGLSDGVELAHACIDGCAGNTDTDGDTLLDGAEIAAGSDPCSTDTDDDGLDDPVDNDPLVPLTPEEVSEEIDDIAADVGDMPPSAFEGPNANAQAARQRVLEHRLEAAADAIAEGDLEGAIQLLEDALKWLDGDPSPPDIMPDGPAKTELRTQIEAQIALLEILLTG